MLLVVEVVVMEPPGKPQPGQHVLGEEVPTFQVTIRATRAEVHGR